MVLTDAQGLPLGIDTASASPHEVTLIEPLLKQRVLRRYRRRWKVERSISLLQSFRRLVTLYEYHAHLFHRFIQLACLIVVLGQF